MVLGGQHIAAALLSMRKRIKNVPNPPTDGSIPRAYVFAKATILHPHTPYKICRAAAGYHQSLQHRVTVTSFADTFRYLMQLSLEKQQAQQGTYLNDDELYGALIAMGLVQPAKKELSLLGHEEISSNEAIELQHKEVRYTF